MVFGYKSSHISISLFKIYYPTRFYPEAHVTDVVLNVVHIKELSRNLGASVTIKEVKNAVHDVFLSKPEVRSGVYTEMFDWLNLHFNYARILLESEPTLSNRSFKVSAFELSQNIYFF